MSETKTPFESNDTPTRWEEVKAWAMGVALFMCCSLTILCVLEGYVIYRQSQNLSYLEGMVDTQRQVIKKDEELIQVMQQAIDIGKEQIAEQNRLIDTQSELIGSYKLAYDELAPH